MPSISLLFYGESLEHIVISILLLSHFPYYFINDHLTGTKEGVYKYKRKYKIIAFKGLRIQNNCVT